MLIHIQLENYKKLRICQAYSQGSKLSVKKYKVPYFLENLIEGKRERRVREMFLKEELVKQLPILKSSEVMSLS